MINGFEEMQAAGRDGMNKSMQSFAALSRGWQTLATEAADFSKQSFEAGAAHFEKLLGLRTLDRAVEAQSDFVKRQYEKAVGQASRMGELYLDVVKDVVKPFEGFAPARTK